MIFTKRERNYLLALLDWQERKTKEAIRKECEQPSFTDGKKEKLHRTASLIQAVTKKLTGEIKGKTDRFCSISSAHLSRKTWLLLQVLEGESSDLPVYFPKRIQGVLYGYIFAVPGWDDDETAVTAVPEDLQACMEYAQSLDCDLLVIDGDCQIVAELPVYNW